MATTGSIPVAIGGVASASTGWAEITGPLQLGIANAGVGDTMAAGWFGWRVLGGTPAACSKNTTINNSCIRQVSCPCPAPSLEFGVWSLTFRI